MHTARRSGRSRSVMHCMRSREDHNASKAMLLTSAAPGPEGEEGGSTRAPASSIAGGVVGVVALMGEAGGRGGLASARDRNTHFFSSLSSLGSKNGSFH